MEICGYTENNTKQIVWKNPRPSSPRFCRPISILLLKETPESTIAQVDNIKELENNLLPFDTTINGIKIHVNYKLQFTMLDGKVCNSVTNTASAMRCYICDATSSEFNNIDEMLKKTIDENNLQFGLTTIHA